VENASFEESPLGDGQHITAYVPGWQAFGNTGYQNPSNALFPAAPDGSHVAWVGTGIIGGSMFEGSLAQTLGESVQANTRYSLSVDVGRRGDGYDLSDFAVELLAGETVLGSGSFTNSDVLPGQFQTLKVDYDALAALAGPLTIRFRTFFNPAQGAIYRQVDFDNVRVETTALAVAAVPEPATWAMMLAGFGGVGAVLRRRRTVSRPAAA
jgi:hypothetical protein